ncbi:MAG: hypothetical protein Q8862_14275, partial [Bacteroidota bacterium]|nr:hypothetical protein [Bacteroidota bacterium]
MKKEHHTDELFRHKLGNHEVAPPEFLWDKIAEQLDQDKKNVRVVWFKRIAVAASLLLAFIAGWQLHQSHNMQLKGDSVSIVKTRDVKPNVVDRGNDYLSIKKESVVKNEHITQAYKSGVEKSSVVNAKLPVAKSLQSGVASLGKPKVSSNREVAMLAANAISFPGKQIRPTVSLKMNVVNTDSVKNQELRKLIRIPSIENRKFENTIETALLQKSRIGEKSLSETDKLIMTRNLEQLKSPKEKKKLNFSVGAQFASSASFNNPQNSNYA